jgi:hypothetical protein
MKENNYRWNYKNKGMVGKNDFTPKIISPYSPQRDKALIASKKKIKNNGTNS